MAERPDPQRSRAVLIGAASFDSQHLPAIPKAGTNLQSMREVLTDPGLWGLPADHVFVSDEPPRIPFQHVRRPIAEAARKATDTLLVYFIGHGLVHKRRLYLAISNTETDFVTETAVAWDEIKRELAKAKARTKIAILDCCFAERAVVDGVVTTLSGDEAHAAPEDAVTYVLCATSKTEAAESGDGPRTLFTDEIYTLLQHGIPNGPEQLTLRGVHDEVRRRFAILGQPTPKFFSHPDPAADTVLFRPNPLWVPPGTAPPDLQPGMRADDVIDGLRQEQAALIAARPGYRPPRRSGTETPQLSLVVDSADEAGGRFDIRVTGVGDHSVVVTLLAAQIEHARNPEPADDEEDVFPGLEPELDDEPDEPESAPEEKLIPVRPPTPLLDLLAAALGHRLLKTPGALAWAPHKIGNAYPPPDEVIRPGAADSTRPVIDTQAAQDVRGLLDAEQHVLLVGAGASGKTTIARSQAWVQAGTHGDGLIWLDLTDPHDGVDSVMLTLLGLPRHRRYLLVVDNLQAQAPDDRGRHPVLDLLAGLKEELGLRVAMLATGWPQIEERIDQRAYGLEPVYTRSLQVIQKLLRDLPGEARDEIIGLAPDDIEVAQVALDFYHSSGPEKRPPDRREVAAHFAKSVGAARLTDPTQRRLLYWFACLCALEIDIPQHQVASWPEKQNHVAFWALRKAGLVEPLDEAWTIGNSTRARLLMEYALAEWSDVGLASRGRIVYDHLRRLGPQHIRNTLGQLRLKFESSERGDLGNLWAECVDLTHRLEALSRADPTWGDNVVNAAFVATALGAMRSERTAAVYGYVRQALDVLDPPVPAMLGDGSPAVPVPAGARQGAVVSLTDTRLLRTAGTRFDPRDLDRRLVLAVLLAAESWATAKGAVPHAVPREHARVRRFLRLGLESLSQEPGGALGPHDEPWVTAMIMSGLIRLSGNPGLGAVSEAAVWLSTDQDRGGPFRNGWAAGPWTTARTSDPADQLEVFVTAFCARALNDAGRPASNTVVRAGLDLLRAALPALRTDGAQVNRTAALATLLHCERRWQEYVEELHELLDWTIVTIGQAAHSDQAAADRVPWVASLLLTVVPDLVQDELEKLVLQVLQMAEPPEEYPPVPVGPPDGFPPPDQDQDQDQNAAAAMAAKAAEAATAEAAQTAAVEAAETAAAELAAAARERLAMVRRHTDTLMYEIEGQILQRRSTLRGISDREAQQAIGAVLAQWQGYQEKIELARQRLETEDIDTVIAQVNEIGGQVFANSWQDIETE